MIKWYNKLPPKEKVLKIEYVSQDTLDTVRRNVQLRKQIKKLSTSSSSSSSSSSSESSQSKKKNTGISKFDVSSGWEGSD